MEEGFPGGQAPAGIRRRSRFRGGGLGFVHLPEFAAGGQLYPHFPEPFGPLLHHFIHVRIVQDVPGNVQQIR